MEQESKKGRFGNQTELLRTLLTGNWIKKLEGDGKKETLHTLAGSARLNRFQVISP
jgi:hypothetical protein